MTVGLPAARGRPRCGHGHRPRPRRTRAHAHDARPAALREGLAARLTRAGRYLHAISIFGPPCLRPRASWSSPTTPRYASPDANDKESRTMLTRPSRTVLALSATLALTISALAPTAALAKGPGGNGDCDGDCTSDQPQAQQQVRARDGSGSGSSQSTQTKANAGGGGQVQARAGNDGNAQAQNKNAQQNRNVQQNKNVNGTGQNAKSGAGQGPNDDGQRGPGSCDECDARDGHADRRAGGRRPVHGQRGEAGARRLRRLRRAVRPARLRQHRRRRGAPPGRPSKRDPRALRSRGHGLRPGRPASSAIPTIASLYATLIEQGSASLEEAIAVGVLIEETDIADLAGAHGRARGDRARCLRDVLAPAGRAARTTWRHSRAGSRDTAC